MTNSPSIIIINFYHFQSSAASRSRLIWREKCLLSTWIPNPERPMLCSSFKVISATRGSLTESDH